LLRDEISVSDMRALVCSSTHRISYTAFSHEMPRRSFFHLAVVGTLAAILVMSPAILRAQDSVRTTPPVEETHSLTAFRRSVKAGCKSWAKDSATRPHSSVPDYGWT